MTRFAILLAAALAFGAPATADTWTPLVTPAEAEALIEDEAVVIDIRSVKDYAAGHLETAVNLPYHAWRGPEDNPGALIDDAKVSALLREAGIEPATPVIVTNAGRDSLDFGAAARVYWTLKSAGVERVAILNGGLAAWTRDGRGLSSAEWSNIPSDANFTLAPDWTIDRAGVEAVLDGSADAILIDARPEDFFTGKTKHKLATWAGTLAGALNLDHDTLFTAPGVLNADPQAIRARAEAAGWTPGRTVVSFCNTGHWAATNWFALSELAGIEGVKLYPESMVDFTRASQVSTGG
ncbi:rhodanese-like domain-containing protein [Limibaculum sp. FT325]|uniref:sulfurtransferase n=1 Tax=Thermohalobaculum sediminis TaxID=2939436 RepID=UPI0020BE0BC7|nr:rhodanese-like domain-containing protein [Limibaculum sediminis]MCL5777267.1 rhodanese-like domain-containing protein [Limibaculum sediminis]